MNASFRTFVVVNPNSSNGRTGKRWPAIAAAIRKDLGQDFVHRFTEKPLDAIALTRQALQEGYEMVVSVGGDGTHNEVVNGFFDEAGKPINPAGVLAVLSSGTGGDFRKTLKIPAEPALAAGMLGGRSTRPLDVGVMEYIGHDDRPARRHFLNIVSCGVGGLVDHYVNHATKLLGGKVSFFIGGFKALLTFRNQTIRVRIDDTFDEVMLLNNLVVANGQFFGGGMHVAPMADPGDGQFEVILFGDLSKLEYLNLAFSIYQGKHLAKPGISHYRGRRIVAESAERVLIDMDGEQPGRLPATLTLLPAAIQLKVS